MPPKDPKKLAAEIEKAHREIVDLQKRIHEMEVKRERLLGEAKESAKKTRAKPNDG